MKPVFPGCSRTGGLLLGEAKDKSPESPGVVERPRSEWGGKPHPDEWLSLVLLEQIGKTFSIN